MTTEDTWVIGHKQARATHPHLVWQVSNWQVEHRACSDASGQQGVIDKAKADALAEHGIFPSGRANGETPPLPVSLSRGTEQAFVVRDALQWANVTQAAPGWLQPYLALPADASPPLAMTPVHPETTGSYGPQAIEWIERTQGIALRWWQRLAIVRQLEHRADGSLVWRSVVESCPRRAGKSVRIRGLALWRMAHADLIGEVQTVVHVGNDLPICREIQRGAWRWSEAQGWAVTRGNGKEAIETPDGSRWVVRSQEGAYGWDACLAVVDEGWDVKPETVADGLEPAMLERLSAQLHLTSTAHRRATSLMRSRISLALAGEDGETLLLLWGASPDADPGDPETWRAASPHWSEDRARMIAAKYAAALAGQADPEADDPDPLAGFVAQYLNVWRLNARALEKGDALISAEAWDALAEPLPDRKPDAVALESWYAEGVSVALAWRLGDQALVKVLDLLDLDAAARAIKATGYRSKVIVGASLTEDPALSGLRTTSGKGRVTQAVLDLSRLISEGLAHDGGAHLTGQVLGVRTVPGTDGPRLTSRGRADAIKAAVWASTAARSKTLGKPRILLPTGS